MRLRFLGFRQRLKLILSLVFVAFLLFRYVFDKNTEQRCVVDYSTGLVVCRPACQRGEFAVPRMTKCHLWLTCADIDSVKIMNQIGSGLVKTVYTAKWSGYIVAVNVLRSTTLRPDFLHGLEMLIHLQPNELAVQLIGYCKETDIFLTEYHSYGSADNLSRLLASEPVLHDFDSPELRFRLCVNYVQILSLLHDRDGPIGKRVMCDSNDLTKTLQQFLLTADLRIVLNDLDALPEVRPEIPVKCGHREIGGDFAAPEQHWPYDERQFDDALMPGYDEKTDIWKVPDVCGDFLGDQPACRAISFRLFKIHNLCKELKPELRPSAQEILNKYRTVWNELGFSTFRNKL